MNKKELLERAQRVGVVVKTEKVSQFVMKFILYSGSIIVKEYNRQCDVYNYCRKNNIEILNDSKRVIPDRVIGNEECGASALDFPAVVQCANTQAAEDLVVRRNKLFSEWLLDFDVTINNLKDKGMSLEGHTRVPPGSSGVSGSRVSLLILCKGEKHLSGILEKEGHNTIKKVEGGISVSYTAEYIIIFPKNGRIDIEQCLNLQEVIMKKKPVHLCYNIEGAGMTYAAVGETLPEGIDGMVQIINDLGIKFSHKVVRSLGPDCIFWNCINIPDKLPKFVTVFFLKPEDLTGGYGFTDEEAAEITDFSWDG